MAETQETEEVENETTATAEVARVHQKKGVEYACAEDA